jgi:hypothetical protein
MFSSGEITPRHPLRDRGAFFNPQIRLSDTIVRINPPTAEKVSGGSGLKPGKHLPQSQRYRSVCAS